MSSAAAKTKVSREELNSKLNLLDLMVEDLGQPDSSGRFHCPSHDDKKASLEIYNEGRKYNCQPCGNFDGDAVSWLMDGPRKMTYPQVIEMVNPPATKPKKGKPPRYQTHDLICEFIYCLEDGTSYAKVEKWVNKKDKSKDFPQFHADGYRSSDGKTHWVPGMKDVRRIPYNLPGIIKARETGKTVYILEGEKDADRANSLELTATTIPEGAKIGKPNPHIGCLKEPLQGLNVVIILDNDQAGHSHGNAQASSLHGVAASVKVLDLTGLPSGKNLPEKGDFSDFLDLGGKLEEITDIVPSLPEWEPPANLPETSNATDDRLPVLGDSNHHTPTLDRIEFAIAKESTLFCRGTSLVSVHSSDGGRRRREPNTPDGMPSISVLTADGLMEIVTRHVDYIEEKPNRSGQMVEVPCMPKRWIVNELLARHQYLNTRSLKAIIEAPTIRPDGTILDQKGWDESTALLYLPTCEFDPIPEFPTLADAQNKLLILMELVADFPFKSDAHRFVWLAAMFTVMVRDAIDGPVPMFIIDATTPGSGKTMLANIVAVAKTGRNIAVKAFPEDDAEMRKTITSIAIDGSPLILFDNIAAGSKVGGSSLEAALTATSWKDRLLAKNEAPTLPLNTVFFASGNNITTRGDTSRRTLFCSLETNEINPEERPKEDFRIKGSLIAHVKARRGEIVSAVLTILRAHAVEGYPQPACVGPEFGSFEGDWSRIVRHSIAWVSGVDPCEVRREARRSDEDSLALATLVQGIKTLIADEKADSPNGATVQEILAILRKADGTDSHPGLRELFASWSKTNDFPTAGSLGIRLKKYLGRPSEHGSLSRTTVNGCSYYFVKSPRPLKPSGSSGSSGTISGDSPYTTREIDLKVFPDGNKTVNAGNTPTTPTTPTRRGKVVDL